MNLPLERSALSSLILCPVCDDRHTHLIEVRSGSWGHAERLDVELTMTCESGHGFTVVVHQNRGQTEVRAQVSVPA